MYTDIVFFLFFFICAQVKGSRSFLFHKFIYWKIYSAV